MIAESKFAIQTFAVKVLFVLLCNKKENNLYPPLTQFDVLRNISEGNLLLIIVFFYDYNRYLLDPCHFHRPLHIQNRKQKK